MAMFFEILLVLVILSAMVMILLAISQLSKSENFDNADDTLDLIHELKEKGNVVSSHNIFNNLLEGDKKEENKPKSL